MEGVVANLVVCSHIYNSLSCSIHNLPVHGCYLLSDARRTWVGVRCKNRFQVMSNRVGAW